MLMVIQSMPYHAVTTIIIPPLSLAYRGLRKWQGRLKWLKWRISKELRMLRRWKVKLPESLRQFRPSKGISACHPRVFRAEEHALPQSKCQTWTILRVVGRACITAWGQHALANTCLWLAPSFLRSGWLHLHLAPSFLHSGLPPVSALHRSAAALAWFVTNASTFLF